MNEHFVISVIIPNYNGSKFIKETIFSVLNQSYPHFEIIVVDDGSTDDSENVVCNIHDKRISFHHRSDSYVKGANACRNIGIDKAIGEYLIFLDSDDLLDKHCLENRINFLQHNRNLDFAVFNSASFVDKIVDGHVFTRLNVKEPIEHFICTDNLWQTASVIWKREFVKQIGGYNLAYQRLQDPEMTMRAFLASNGNYKLVPESAADTYYRRPPNLGNKKLSKSYKAMSQFIKDFYIPSNEKYINQHNTMFMFLIFTTLHLKYWETEQDMLDYKERVSILSAYNNSIAKVWIYKLSSCGLKKPYIVRRILSSIVGRINLRYKKRYLTE